MANDPTPIRDLMRRQGIAARGAKPATMPVLAAPTLLPLTTASGQQQPLPALTSEAWTEPATAAEADEVVSQLLAMVDPQADVRRAVLYAQMVGQRGYSRAELLHALRSLPFDSEASHRFGRGLNLADIERAVEKVRAVRASLRRLLTADEVAAAVRASAGTITHEDFGLGGYDERDRPLYRYIRRPSPVSTAVTVAGEAAR